MEEKMRKGQFSLEDFLEQLRQMKKLGPLESIIGMLPGGSEAMTSSRVTERSTKRRVMAGLRWGLG